MPGGAMGKPVMAKSQGWLLLFLLLWLLKPGMADRWVCWWRLRYWQGVLHFVHPGGWYEPLDEVAIQALFVEEPEMAEYVAGNSHMPDGGLTPFPPYWQPSPGSWRISRTLEDANWKRVWVARPVNLEEHGPPGQPPPRASDGYTGSEAMRATGMGWVPGNEARDGSRRDPCFQASDGCGGASSSSRPSGLLFAVGKGKGKPEMAQDKPEMAQDKPVMAQEKPVMAQLQLESHCLPIPTGTWTGAGTATSA